MLADLVLLVSLVRKVGGLLVVFLGLALLVVGGTRAVAWASFGETLEDYRKNYYLYREFLEEYKLSREEYLKWGTLSARDAAVADTQRFLIQLAKLLDSYYALLENAVLEQPGFESGAKELALSLITEHRTYYQSLEKGIVGKINLVGLEKIARELTADYEQGELDSSLVHLGSSLARNTEAARKTRAFAAELRGMIEADEAYPERELVLENWLHKITYKLDAVESLQNELWESVVDFGGLKYAYEQQRKLSEVSQAAQESQSLLLDVVDHLLEILRRVKY